MSGSMVLYIPIPPDFESSVCSMIVTKCTAQHEIHISGKTLWALDKCSSDHTASVIFVSVKWLTQFIDAMPVEAHRIVHSVSNP